MRRLPLQRGASTLARRRHRGPAAPPVGARVRLIHFGPCACGDPGHDDNQRVLTDTRGTVTSVDDAGTIHVAWDNGRTLGLLPGLDEWEQVEMDTLRRVATGDPA